MARSIPISARRCATATCLAALLAVGACATKVPPPVADLATARTALDAAQSAGALRFAPTEFLSARDKLARAETASHDKNNAEARRWAEEAAVDAELAARKARAANVANTAQELQRANGVLANETARSGKPS